MLPPQQLAQREGRVVPPERRAENNDSLAHDLSLPLESHHPVRSHDPVVQNGRGACGDIPDPSAPALLPRPVTLVHPPVVPRYWTPRNDVLVTLDKWWREGTESVLVLVGLGGTGKSTVVQRWLNDIVGETETGQLEGLVQFSLYEPGDRAFGDFLGLADRALGA